LTRSRNIQDQDLPRSRNHEHQSHIGKFHLTLAKGGPSFEITGGAIVVATGAQPAKTAEFLYGKSDRV